MLDICLLTKLKINAWTQIFSDNTWTIFSHSCNILKIVSVKSVFWLWTAEKEFLNLIFNDATIGNNPNSLGILWPPPDVSQRVAWEMKQHDTHQNQVSQSWQFPSFQYSEKIWALRQDTTESGDISVEGNVITWQWIGCWRTNNTQVVLIVQTWILTSYCFC